MPLRSWVKRLERGARKEMISIPQPDGQVKRFTQSAAKSASAPARTLLHPTPYLWRLRTPLSPGGESQSMHQGRMRTGQSQ